MFSFAMFMSWCVAVMVMSAYVVSITGTPGVVMTDVYMLNSVGNRTPVLFCC